MKLALSRPWRRRSASHRARLDVGLAPGDRLHVLRIDQHDGAPLLQEVVDRIPIHPGRFHGEVVDLLLIQPTRQGQQLRRHGAEGARQLRHLARVRGHQDRGDHRPLVDVESRTPLVEHLHAPPPPSRARRAMAGPSGTTTQHTNRRDGSMGGGECGRNLTSFFGVLPTCRRSDRAGSWTHSRSTFFAGTRHH